jgi:hypothetical protein
LWGISDHAKQDLAGEGFTALAMAKPGSSFIGDQDIRQLRIEKPTLFNGNQE